MARTVLIGHAFIFTDITNEQYYFYGANRITATLWQVNFSQSYSKNNMSFITPFCLNLEVGNSLRFPNAIVYRQKDGSVDLYSGSLINLKGRCEATSIKIVDIGQDFLTIEYELAQES